jgi:hypothetical protein
MDDKRSTWQTDSSKGKEQDRPIHQTIEARDGSVIRDVVQLVIKQVKIAIQAVPQWIRWVLVAIAVATVLIAAKAVYDFYESSQPPVPTAQRLHYFIILDASERMKEGFDGEAKWTVARDAAIDLLSSTLPSRANYGLIVLGGTPESSAQKCGRTPQPVVPLALDTRSDVLSKVKKLRPYGTASLRGAIALARDELLQLPADHEKTFVIITGGGDECGDPADRWTPILDLFEISFKSLGVWTELIVLSGEQIDEEVKEVVQRVHEIENVRAVSASSRGEVKEAVTEVEGNAVIRARQVEPTAVAAEETVVARVTAVAMLSSPALTDTATPTDTPTATGTPSATTTSTDTPVITLVPTTTPQPTPMPAAERSPTHTRLPTKSPTDIPKPSPTYTPSSVPARTPTRAPTPTFTPTSTPMPSATPTFTPTPTDTPTDTPTGTPTNTLTPTFTSMPSETPTFTPTTPLPTDTPPTPTPEVTYHSGSRTIVVHPGDFDVKTGRLCKGKLADVGRNAVFLRTHYLQQFGEPAGLLATITHVCPAGDGRCIKPEGVNVTLYDVEVGQYDDQETNADGEPLDYSNCAFNLTKDMRRQLEVPEVLEGFDSLERFMHGTITITLSSTPVGHVSRDKAKHAGIFAATDQADMANRAITFRQFYTSTAAINGVVTDAGSNDNVGYQIAYDRITTEHYACWGIVLPETDVSGLSRLAFDIKGRQGAEIPNVWLASPSSPQDIRNYVDIENYVTVTDTWQRVEVPLTDFQAQPGEEGIIDLARIVRVQICFEWADMEGMVYVDGFAFE